MITIMLITGRAAVQYTMYYVMYTCSRKICTIDVHIICDDDRPESTSRVIRAVKNRVICNMIVIICYYIVRFFDSCRLQRTATSGVTRMIGF